MPSGLQANHLCCCVVLNSQVLEDHNIDLKSDNPNSSTARHPTSSSFHPHPSQATRSVEAAFGGNIEVNISKRGSGFAATLGLDREART